MPKTLRKDDLVQQVARRTGLATTTVARVVDTLIDELAASLAQGVPVRLAGLGTFTLRHYPARVGRDPRTQGPVPHPERWAPGFRSSSTLRKRVRQGQSSGSPRSSSDPGGDDDGRSA